MREDLTAEPSWKDRLRRDFEHWLASVDDAEDATLISQPEPEEPDLYSFFEQLATLNLENRKANRRTAEVLSQWSDTLTRFDGNLRLLREHLDRLGDPARHPDQMPRELCLVLIEVLDRMRRLAAAFALAPKKTWWGNDDAWRHAWTTQHDGFNILIGHLETLLKQAQVTRIETAGKPFDPTRMIAVAAEPSPQHPHQTVIEEIAAGYLHHGETLRVAQVKVSLNPPSL